MPLVFANPWMLLGLAAAGLPLIIHLISRQRARKLPFSTLRFLLQTDRKTARKHKLVDLLVLLLRTALLLFLALALSRPFFQPHREAGDLTPGPTAWAIVLDDSYSMGLIDEGLSVHAQAIAAVTDLLKAIPEGDEIRILPTSGRSIEGLDSATFQKDRLIDTLQRIEAPSYSDASAGAAVERGLQFLEGAKQNNRALVLVSDFQESALRDALAALSEEDADRKLPPLYWLDVGQPDTANTAIESLRVQQSLPFVGLPMDIRAGLANYGDSPDEQTASLWIDDRKVETQSVDIAPGSMTEAVFRHVPVEAGNMAGEVRLEGDALPADNRRYFTWFVTPRIRIALIHGGADEMALWDDAFYLQSVLQPVVEDPKAGRVQGLRVDPFRLDSVSGIEWGNYQLAIVVGIDRVPPALADRLQSFAREGGSVMAFAAGPDAAESAAVGQAPDVALLDVPAGDAQTVSPSEDRTATLGAIDEQHPIFRNLSRAAARNLSAVEFYQWRRLSPAAMAGDSRTVASYDNGDPFLVERRIGNGRILLFETRCHPDWSNLPVRPLFLMLVYETIKYCAMAQMGLQNDLAPLATLRYRLPDGVTYERAMVRDPEGVLKAHPLGEDVRELIVRSLEIPGVYHVYFQAGENEDEAMVAVNIDPEEGRLERIDPDAVAEHLSATPAHIFTAPRQLVGVLRRQREGVALGAFFLYLAAACFLAECFLANYLIPKNATAPAAAPKHHSDTSPKTSHAAPTGN
jgi:hypothetical protein